MPASVARRRRRRCAEAAAQAAGAAPARAAAPAGAAARTVERAAAAQPELVAAAARSAPAAVAEEAAARAAPAVAAPAAAVAAAAGQRRRRRDSGGAAGRRQRRRRQWSRRRGRRAAAVTVWIAGDSTVQSSGGTPCPIGWGGPFPTLFGTGVTVRNSAVGGRSVRTWLYNVQTTMDATGECVLARDANGDPTLQSRWSAMLNATSGMKAGDYLFIQFGINDSSATCDRHVGVEAFKTSYGVMAQAAKDRGANPIFVTPLSMIRCSGTTEVGSREPYVMATKDAGTQYNVPVIDLHGLSVALYTQHGFCPIPGGDVSATTTGPVGDFFCDDHTHLSSSGAVEIAGLVAQALRDQNIPLAAYLK